MTTPADPFADFPYTLDQVSDAINAALGGVTIFDLQAVSTHIQDYRPGVSAVHDGTGRSTLAKTSGVRNRTAGSEGYCVGGQN